MIQQEFRSQPVGWKCTTCGASFTTRDKADRHDRLTHEDPVEERESMFGTVVRLTSEEQSDLWLTDGECQLNWEGPGWYGPRPRDCVTDKEGDVTYAPIAVVLTDLARLVADLTAYETEIRSIPKETP